MSNLNHNLKKYNYYHGLLGQSKVMSEKDQKMVRYKVKKYKNALMKGGANIKSLDNMNKSSDETMNDLINSVNDLVQSNMKNDNMTGGSNNVEKTTFNVRDILKEFNQLVGGADLSIEGSTLEQYTEGISGQIEKITGNVNGISEIIKQFGEDMTTKIAEIKAVMKELDKKHKSVKGDLELTQTSLIEAQTKTSGNSVENETLKADLESKIQALAEKNKEITIAKEKLDVIYKDLKKLSTTTSSTGDNLNTTGLDEILKSAQEIIETPTSYDTDTGAGSGAGSGAGTALEVGRAESEALAQALAISGDSGTGTGAAASGQADLDQAVDRSPPLQPSPRSVKINSGSRREGSSTPTRRGDSTQKDALSAAQEVLRRADS